jgi:hypothetical protein
MRPKDILLAGTRWKPNGICQTTGLVLIDGADTGIGDDVAFVDLGEVVRLPVTVVKIWERKAGLRMR